MTTQRRSRDVISLPLHQLESFVTSVRRELGLSTPAPPGGSGTTPTAGGDGAADHASAASATVDDVDSPHILVDGSTTRCSICRVSFPDYIVQRAHCRYGGALFVMGSRE